MAKKSALARHGLSLRTGRAAGKLSAPGRTTYPFARAGQQTRWPACRRSRRDDAALRTTPARLDSLCSLRLRVFIFLHPCAARSQRERTGARHDRPPHRYPAATAARRMAAAGRLQRDGRAAQGAVRARPDQGAVALRRRRRAAVRHGRRAPAGREQDGRHGRAATRPRVTHVLPGRDRRPVHRRRSRRSPGARYAPSPAPPIPTMRSSWRTSSSSPSDVATVGHPQRDHSPTAETRLGGAGAWAEAGRHEYSLWPRPTSLLPVRHYSMPGVLGVGGKSCGGPAARMQRPHRTGVAPVAWTATDRIRATPGREMTTTRALPTTRGPRTPPCLPVPA